MKKSMLLLSLLTCLSFSYGQETVFLETCGNTDVSSSKKVDVYTGWDNAAPVIYSRTTTLDGCADVRITASTNNHVWFPTSKSSDLIISNIRASSYKNLKLSFDMAAYKLTDANVNKLKLYCNDSALTLPSTTITSQKFIPVTDISLGHSNTITLRFEYTAESNTNGYRLDNICITGEKATSELTIPAGNPFTPIISGDRLLIPGIANGNTIEILNPSGSIVQSSILKNGFIRLNSKIAKGLYIVRAGKSTCKIIF